MSCSGFLRRGLFLCALTAIGSPDPALAQQQAAGFDVYEASIAEMQDAMSAGRVTSAQLVDAYLARIEAYDQQGPRLNAILRINSAARAQAEQLDRERAERGPRGPLHGIPIVMKDNYDVAEMPTTGGSIALANHQPLRDAYQVRKLREAGAIVLAKTNLHELAYGTTTISSLGGQTRNPYDPRRNPGGSSGGTGASVAASFAAIGWGSDTCASIRVPAGVHNLVGLRPTKGLSSIDGILPLSHTQDVGGPLARSVGDLVIGLDATIGADPADPATAVLAGRALPRFSEALDPSALRGARIGVLRQYFGTAAEERETNEIVAAALETMRGQGAEIIEIQIPGFEEAVRGTSLIDFEFKWDLLDYLARTPGGPVSSLGDILASGLHHQSLTAILRRSDLRESRAPEGMSGVLAKREDLHQLIAAVMDEHGLSALAYPTLRRETGLVGEPAPGNNCQLSASTGMPALTIPAGFSARQLPVGLELLGRRFDDAELVSLGYAFEFANQPRRPPAFTPALTNGQAPTPVEFVTRVPLGATDAGARATFTYDPVLGTLDYRVVLEGVQASEVQAVVLRNGAGGPIVHRLIGPGNRSSSGRLSLELADRRAFQTGQLRMQLFAGEGTAPASEAVVQPPQP